MPTKTIDEMKERTEGELGLLFLDEPKVWIAEAVKQQTQCLKEMAEGVVDEARFDEGGCGEPWRPNEYEVLECDKDAYCPDCERKKSNLDHLITYFASLGIEVGNPDPLK